MENEKNWLGCARNFVPVILRKRKKTLQNCRRQSVCAEMRQECGENCSSDWIVGMRQTGSASMSVTRFAIFWKKSKREISQKRMWTDWKSDWRKRMRVSNLRWKSWRQSDDVWKRTIRNRRRCLRIYKMTKSIIPKKWKWSGENCRKNCQQDTAEPYRLKCLQICSTLQTRHGEMQLREDLEESNTVLLWSQDML